MGAKKWGDALPGKNRPSEVEELRALLIEKGVLTEAEVAQARGKPQEAATKRPR